MTLMVDLTENYCDFMQDTQCPNVTVLAITGLVRIIDEIYFFCPTYSYAQ